MQRVSDAEGKMADAEYIKSTATQNRDYYQRRVEQYNHDIEIADQMRKDAEVEKAEAQKALEEENRHVEELRQEAAAEEVEAVETYG